MRAFFLLLPFFISLPACGPDQSSDKQKGIRMKVDLQVSAAELSNQHAADRKATNERYGGKKLMITGRVFETGFTRNQIHGIAAQTVEIDGPKDDIKCFLKEGSRAEALEKGMKVKVAGTYLKADLYPMLKDCKIEVLKE